MDRMFAPEYFDMIFRFLLTYKDLHSCLLVNRHWATCAVPILWEAPFKIKDNYIPSPKVIKTYLAFIPDSTFLKLGYNRRIGLSITRPLFFNYPSFLKELSYDQFLNAAIANKCCKDIITELFKIFVMHNVILRKLDIYNNLNYYPGILNNLRSWVLPHFSECTSIFNRLTYFNCSDHWEIQKTQLFNIIAENCHNIENLKASICYKDEGMALAFLIRSQKHLKKFSLINSNKFASFPVLALMDQKHSLKSVTFKDMHQKRIKTIYFNYSACQLNSSAINLLTQCTNINKLKFKHCEGLNSPAYFSLGTAFSNLTSLEYSYGDYNIYDDMIPVQLLSDLIMTSCNTLKKIVLDWYILFHLDITQLVKMIAQHVVNLEYLKIPLNTLEQLALIHRTYSPLRRLEIHLDKKINLHCALSLLANVPLKSHEHSIQLSFGHNKNFDLKINQLNQIFESIFYKSNRIVDFILHLNNGSIEKRVLLLRNYPRLKINILSGSILNRHLPDVIRIIPERCSCNELLEICNNLLKINSNDIWALKQHLNKSLEIDPNNANSLGIRGRTHYMAGNYESSLKDINKSLRIEPTNAIALGYLFSKICLLVQNYEEGFQDCFES
ncbi:21433_t:CDS:2, partial [Cetraspora pellucida]